MAWILSDWNLASVRMIEVKGFLRIHCISSPAAMQSFGWAVFRLSMDSVRKVCPEGYKVRYCLESSLTVEIVFFKPSSSFGKEAPPSFALQWIHLELRIASHPIGSTPLSGASLPPCFSVVRYNHYSLV